MKPAALFITLCVLAVSGCKKDDSGPTGGGGNTAPFEFVAGHTCTYTGQAYETNGTPIPNSTIQAAMSVLTTGQTIGGVPNAAILRTSYTQGTELETDNYAVAYDQDKFMVYNGSSSDPNISPSIPGWATLFDFSRDVSTRSLFSYDSTYHLTMHSGAILSDRVRYNATIRYAGEEAVPAFGTSGILCSKYLFTFTYDAVIDTGGVVLYNGNVINATTMIWFSPGIGFVRMRGDGTQMFMGRLRPTFRNLTVYHDPPGHQHHSLGVSYFYFDFGGGQVYESLTLRAGTNPQSGYSIFDGTTKNF